MLVKKFLKLLESPRVIVSVLTLVVLVVILFLSRKELRDAWLLLEQTNIAILSLLIPFQIMVYYANGEMIFSYLRKRGLVKSISWFEQTRIALELNLVNHIFPSGGVSGISYATWRLHKLGVPTSQATFAQVVRYVMGFLALAILLIISVLLLAIDGQVNRYIVAASFLLVLLIFALTGVVAYMFSSDKRMSQTAGVVTRLVNWLVRKVTLGRKRGLLSADAVRAFFEGMHRDFKELAINKSRLIKPFIWGVVFTIFDIAMFVAVFWALGQSVNPAILMVGYGVAGLASLVAFTPGGAGVYELIMILFLQLAGVSSDAAIAGIVLARSILLAGTIFFGYLFYQHAILKYGKRSNPTV